MERSSLTYDTPFEFIPFNEPIFVNKGYAKEMRKRELNHFNNKSDWKGIDDRAINEKWEEYSISADVTIKLSNTK